MLATRLSGPIVLPIPLASYLVSVPDPKPTPARIAFSILEAIYTPDEVWGQDRLLSRPLSHAEEEMSLGLMPFS